MSDSTIAAEACESIAASHQQFDAYPAREVHLGTLSVVRALPVKGKRLIGPWCFLDRFGPVSFGEGAAMDVAPHPHIGLQTVTWLLAGEIVHDDSLQQEAVLRPGGVNVMTSGHAIAHAERTPDQNTGRLNGVQLWAALPDRDRHGAAFFQHLPEVPRIEPSGGIVQVFSGALADAISPATHFSDLVGADLRVHPRHELALPLQRQHEHALLVLSGDCALEGQRLDERILYYLGTQRSEMCLTSAAGARLLLIGGTPFPETILMWWNFVARTPDEIRDARNDWEAHRRFGDVPAYRGSRIPAPSLVRLAQPNPVS
jgi:redox-sensitive bicupin YhaK (pirin superfamily)